MVLKIKGDDETRNVCKAGKGKEMNTFLRDSKKGT